MKYLLSATDPAARAVIGEIRAQPWGTAVALIRCGEAHLEVHAGAGQTTEATAFQFGSVTKTLTGLLLADCVTRGQTSLHATVGSIIGSEAGPLVETSLLALATHISGLPKLPPNLDTSRVDPNNPYGAFQEADLWEALRLVKPTSPGRWRYSNFGFMLLGALLRRVTGLPFCELAAERVFKPLGMATTAVGVPQEECRATAYRGGKPVPWWHNPLPGAGGMAGSIRDLLLYLQAHLAPPAALAQAVALATAKHAPGPPEMGLGWMRQGKAHWHNGGTGGFRSFAGFHAPVKCAVGILVNSAEAAQIDGIGMKLLQDMARTAA